MGQQPYIRLIHTNGGGGGGGGDDGSDGGVDSDTPLTFRFHNSNSNNKKDSSQTFAFIQK